MTFIAVATVDGKEVVAATRFGPLAVHKSTSGNEVYHITHIETGLKLPCDFSTQPAAEGAAEDLCNWINWDTFVWELARGHSKITERGRILNMCISHGGCATSPNNESIKMGQKQLKRWLRNHPR